MGDLEAAGELVTGGLVAGAVERHAAGHGGHGEGALCLNCGTRLRGPHCHECGQSAHIHRSLGAIGHEILHGVAHFEGKLWRTLPLLVWRPGELTRRYIAGERARFVSPMAIFLFSIFTMFAVFSFAGISMPADLKPEVRLEDGLKAARSDLADERSDLVEKRRDLLEAAQEAPGDAEKQARNQARVRTIDAQIADVDQRRRELEGVAQGLDRSGIVSPSGVEAHTGWAKLDHGIEKWQKNAPLMLYKLQSASYKFSWLLIPLSLPFMWLMFFWKRGYQLYDHTVFITYSIAFMSLLFIALTVANALGASSDVLALIAAIVPPVHIARQLKQAYRLRWRSAILRTVLLLVFITIILTLFLLALLLLGLFG